MVNKSDLNSISLANKIAMKAYVQKLYEESKCISE